MKKNILFVTPKWCDGLPELGFNNDFHNHFTTIMQSRPDCTIHTIYTDECALIYGCKIDNIIKKYVTDNKISIILYSLINGRDYNPSVQCMRDLKESVAQCIFWYDTGPDWGLKSIEQIGNSVDYHFSWDNPKGPFHEKEKLPNHLTLWTPEDPTLFDFDSRKDIDVSFLGSIDMYRDRIETLNLLHNKIKLVVSGGQRAAKLSPYQYASIIRRSKIGINFALSQTGVFWQAKGRIFEYTASGGLLLDSRNPCTPDYFRPGIDYIEFSTVQDIIDIVQYYLQNSEIRQKIALSGYNRFKELWTAQKYWDTVISKLERQ